MLAGTTADRVFRALADPGRRRMLDAMQERERSVGELARLLAVSQPAASQHLAVLRTAGLVSERKQGRQRLYRVEPAGLADAMGWFLKYQTFWTKRLEALEQHLGRQQP